MNERGRRGELSGYGWVGWQLLFYFWRWKATNYFVILASASSPIVPTLPQANWGKIESAKLTLGGQPFRWLKAPNSQTRVVDKWIVKIAECHNCDDNLTVQTKGTILWWKWSYKNIVFNQTFSRYDKSILKNKIFSFWFDWFDRNLKKKN